LENRAGSEGGFRTQRKFGEAKTRIKRFQKGEDFSTKRVIPKRLSWNIVGGVCGGGVWGGGVVRRDKGTGMGTGKRPKKTTAKKGKSLPGQITRITKYNLKTPSNRKNPATGEEGGGGDSRKGNKNADGEIVSEREPGEALSKQQRAEGSPEVGARGQRLMRKKTTPPEGRENGKIKQCEGNPPERAGKKGVSSKLKTCNITGWYTKEGKCLEER